MTSAAIWDALPLLSGKMNIAGPIVPQIRSVLVDELGYVCHGPGVGAFPGWAVETGHYLCFQERRCLVFCVCSGNRYSIALHLNIDGERLKVAKVVNHGCNITLP